MCRTRSIFIPLAALALLGCLEDPSAPMGPDRVSDPTELSFTVPSLEPSDLIPFTLTVHDGGAAAPYPVSIDDGYRPSQQISNARTTTGFYTGQAWAEGSHNYIGNVGRVETTAGVTVADKHLADQVVVRQEFKPFLLQFGQKEFIFAFAPVYTDHKCGLTVRGSSVHSASWEFYQGTGASAWGEALQTSVAQTSSQGDCSGRGTSRGTDVQPDGTVCYYLVTYDLDTGVVVSADLLFCTSSSSEVF